MLVCPARVTDSLMRPCVCFSVQSTSDKTGNLNLDILVHPIFITFSLWFGLVGLTSYQQTAVM